MDALTPGLAAHKGLRGHILLALKMAQPLTAAELAERHGVTPNAVRRHLKELEVERLVEYSRERRGQGAPVNAYRLTPDGEGLFPKRYDRALTALLEFLERTGGREEVRRFFTERFTTHAERILARLEGGSLEDRVEAVAEFLTAEGFMAEWRLEDGTLRIAEHNCAMHAVAERFPEVCESELEFLRRVLGPGLTRRRHIVSGCNSCEYALTVSDDDAVRENA